MGNLTILFNSPSVKLCPLLTVVKSYIEPHLLILIEL